MANGRTANIEYRMGEFVSACDEDEPGEEHVFVELSFDKPFG
jgi:hypothetical protein